MRFAELGCGDIFEYHGRLHMCVHIGDFGELTSTPYAVNLHDGRDEPEITGNTLVELVCPAVPYQKLTEKRIDSDDIERFSDKVERQNAARLRGQIKLEMIAACMTPEELFELTGIDIDNDFRTLTISEISHLYAVFGKEWSAV